MSRGEDRPRRDDEPRASVGHRARDARHDQAGVAVDELQRLWAPWRYGYIADEDDGIDGCPFCVLPERGDDRASLIVARGRRCYVIFNAYPYNPGHLMVVPYAHVGRLDDLDDAAAAEVWEWGRRTVVALERTVSCQGVNLGMNLGPAAGAGIADHLHLHAVPRWFGDTNFISTVAASRVLPRALEEMYDLVRAGFEDDVRTGRDRAPRRDPADGA